MSGPGGVARLFGVEVRRYLARRLTRVLIGLALVASATAGILVFVNAEASSPAARAEARSRREADVGMCTQANLGRGPVFGPDGQVVEIDPSRSRTGAGTRRAEEQCRRMIDPASYDRQLHLVDLWHTQEGGESFLGITFVFLGIGALVGGASMVGAEWKADAFTTLLTWEPRRLRVAVVKLAAAGVLAVVVSALLQLVFIGALAPTVALRGTTAGADAEWLRGLAGAMGRGAALAGLGAIVGGAVAMIGRSTAAALGVAFAYLAVFEAVIRAWKPTMARWLLGENAAIFLTGRRLQGAPFDRPVVVAAVTLLGIAAGLVVLAAATLRGRDVAA